MDGEKSVVQDEKVLKEKSGYAMLLLGIIGMLLGVAVIIAGCMVFGQTGETNTALLAGSITVSYTHLDVYKRQVLYIRRHM